MSYSVPQESAKLLLQGIIQNPLLQHNVPENAEILAKKVQYSGNVLPSIPINWRFAESISSLKGLSAIWLNSLLEAKYGVAPAVVEIDTDHASLFVVSALLTDVVDEHGTPVGEADNSVRRVAAHFRLPFTDQSQSTLYRASTTNIYRTRNGRFYHIHGSLDARPTLQALGLPIDKEVDNKDEATKYIQARVAKYTAEELDHLINDVSRQPGTIAFGVEEYRETQTGRANSKAGLWEITHRPNPLQAPTWWKQSPPTSPKRPLAGLKVVDLSRVLAGPTIGRELAEYGASVMKVTASSLPDFVNLHAEMNWGKWSTFIDLKTEAGKQALWGLIRDADVVIDGFRPGVMERFGFGREAVLEQVKDRSFGLIYVRENTYGWHGPWKDRCGWQQISDACCGVSLEYGRATGHDEAITPILPNSDYSTGLLGACGVLNALVRRGKEGGSFFVDTALNYYSQWLTASGGVYPPDVWEELWNRHNRLSFRHWGNMPALYPALLKSLYQHSRETLFQPEFFQVRFSKAMNLHFKCLKPVLRFPGEQVKPGYHLGTRPNGTDAPHWPEDLETEIVKE